MHQMSQQKWSRILLSFSSNWKCSWYLCFANGSRQSAPCPRKPEITEIAWAWISRRLQHHSKKTAWFEMFQIYFQAQLFTSWSFGQAFVKVCQPIKAPAGPCWTSLDLVRNTHSTSWAWLGCMHYTGLVVGVKISSLSDERYHRYHTRALQDSILRPEALEPGGASDEEWNQSCGILWT